MSTSIPLFSTVSAVDGHVAALVHPDVGLEARASHARFLVTRLLVGLVALAALPLYLVLFGVPGVFEAAAFICLAMPLGAGFVLSRTGRLDWAHGISSAALAALVATIACASGGVGSPVLPWLVGVPLEALLSGSRRAVITASIVAGLAAVAVAILDMAGAAASLLPWDAMLAMPIFAATAIAHAAAVGLEACRAQAARDAERAARDARTRLVLESIDDLLTWHDRSGAVLLASAAAEGMLGMAPRALEGQGLFERVHVADRPAYLKALTDVANGERAASVEFRLNASCRARDDIEAPAGAPWSTRPSRVIWVDMRVRPVTADDGTPYAVIAVTRDMSERKRHEDELDAARTIAEEANASKGRFLATVSHELRTPLNAIIGFSEILATDGPAALDAGRRTEYARIVHTSGQHLNEVVGALLDMSKMETGNFDFLPEPFDPEELAHGCCDLMQLKADGAGVAMAREIGVDRPGITADRRAVKQIMLNLISNAVKFTPAGGCVTVSLQRRANRLVLGISDTGIGIAEADLPQLGRPFFQARSSYDRLYEGTGLGLSVVRGLIGLHGGSLAIESGPGEGTSVTVCLPLDCRGAAVTREPIVIETIARRWTMEFPDTDMVKRRA